VLHQDKRDIAGMSRHFATSWAGPAFHAAEQAFTIQSSLRQNESPC